MTDIEKEKLKAEISLNYLKQLKQYQQKIITYIEDTIKLCENKLKEIESDRN